MPAEQPITGAYFETPARAERLQLLFHLVRNASDVIYLRAPAGAGKTRFVRRLVDDLGEEMATVWIRAGRDDDIPSAAVAQLGLESDDIIQWPETALDAAGDRDFLVIVDDADRIDLAAVEDLVALHAKGGRVLLIGHGGMAHTTRNWDAQFVDLPSFDVQQTTAFLRAQAGEESACVTDDLAAALHRAAHGLP
ncbi:MAG: ATP-binding protein, partial [Sedimenticolaceae bacterium]